jgi:hypothetical protein
MMYACEKCGTESWSEFDGGICDVCADMEENDDEELVANP